MKLKGILVVLAALGCQVAMAGTMTPVAHEYSPSAEQCLDEAKTGSAVKFCFGVEQAFQENRLDSSYARLASMKNDAGKIDLRNNQKQWDLYRASTCAKRAKGDEASKIDCMALSAKARADFIDYIVLHQSEIKN
jgi:uncharacterized protein YecT (DUF1311 family)